MYCVPRVALFGVNTKNLANCGVFFPLIRLNYISCPVLLVHSFSTYLHSLFLEDYNYLSRYLEGLFINLQLHFCGSPLHFLQLSNMVTTPYMAIDSNRVIIRN